MAKWFAMCRAHVLPDTLPTLRGRWLHAFTAFWIAMASLAIAMSGISAWEGSKTYEYTFGKYGFAAGLSADIHSVSGAEAVAKGIERGDVILAIDGVPVEQSEDNWMSVRERLLKKQDENASFTLRRSDGDVRTVELQADAQNIRAAEGNRVLGLALGLVAIAAFMAAAILLFRRRREPVPALLAMAFVLNLVAADLPGYHWLYQGWIGELLSSANTVSFSLMLLGLLAFPDGRMSRFAWAFAGLLLVWTAAIILLPDNLSGDAFIITFVPLLATAVGRQLVRYRRSLSGITRQQVRWGIFGFAVGAILLTIGAASVFAGEWASGSTVFALRNIASVTLNLAFVAMAGGLVVSLMRYRLYDADTVIGRSAAYGMLTVGFLAVFAGSQEVIEALGNAYFGDQIGALAGGMGAAIAAVLMVPLHRRANDWAERQFQRDLLRLRVGLPRLVSDLRETASTTVIAETVAERAIAGVKATQAALVMNNAVIAASGVSSRSVSAWLADPGIEFAGEGDTRTDPLFSHRIALDCEGVDRVGWLLLGPHPDGSRLGKDERDALDEIAEPVARALAIARARDQEKMTLQGTFDRIEERLRLLEGPVEPVASGVPSVA